MARLAFVDDHAIVRAGLKALLEDENNLEIVGEASGGFELLELAQHRQLDIVLVDISLPDLDGLEVTRRLKKERPELLVLVLTVHEDRALLREALRAGASGYVLKRALERELLSAIQIVLRGELYVDPAFLRDLVEDPRSMKEDPTEIVDPLTPREQEILHFIVNGYTNKQIGHRLHISTRTVEGHRANLLSKIGAKSRVDLVEFARENGIIS